MIPPEEYATRREELMQRFGEDDFILLSGNSVVERNAQVARPFFQNTYVRYLTGIDIPGVEVLLDPREGKYVLFMPEQTPDDAVWHGQSPSLDELRERFGADEIYPSERTNAELFTYKGRNSHTLDPKDISERLRDSLIDLRLVKSPNEIQAIEEALTTTGKIFETAMEMTRPGVNESDIRAAINYYFETHGSTYAFRPIITTEGCVLHPDPTRNELKYGKLLLLDVGEQFEYASDITRTFPVNGKFSDEQRAIYQIVLSAKKAAIGMVQPGVNFKDIHIAAEEIIARGLQEYGVLKGDVDDIVENGAHRLFFPHGLGHALGLEVHDCADFEYHAAGYGPDNPKSEKFGRKSLRFARDLEAGHVVTVEPGIYFIPALLENPGEHAEFINLDVAQDLVDTVSGIRIEDDVLVTADGSRVLGPGIPEEPDDLERIVGARPLV